MMLVLGLGLIGLMANVIRIPVRVLIPVILVLATFGSYGLSGNMAGPLTMVVFGFLGWFMQRHDYSVPACVVGLILGGKVESELAADLSDQWRRQLSYFVGRPIAMVLLVLLLFSLFSRPIMQWWRRRRPTLGEAPQDNTVKST